MKIKKKYIFILVAIIGFSIFYDRYGWVWNPWANDRLVWDEPNPELIGQTFSVTGRFKLDTTKEYLQLPIRKIGVIGHFQFNPENVTGCSSTNTNTIALGNGAFVGGCNKWETITPNLINSFEVFEIEKTYWIHGNMWAYAFAGDGHYKTAIVRNKENQRYTITFEHFKYTTRPDLEKFEKLEEYQSPWDYKNTEIIPDR